MDQRYHQVSFSYLSRKMIWTLAHLKDPEVAQHVRILHVYLDSMDVSLSQSLLSKLTNELSRPCTRLFSQTKTLFPTQAENFPQPHASHDRNLQLSSQSHRLSLPFVWFNFRKRQTCSCHSFSNFPLKIFNTCSHIIPSLFQTRSRN
jgi:hypothetical protein